MKLPSIVFFGSGQISLATVQNLSNKFEIEAVITKPDSILHGRSVLPPPKQWAANNSVPVFQPANKKELSQLISQAKFKSPLGVVAEYGVIIPDSVIDYFPLGLINSHFSLLPRWRGADPIRAAILNGDEETGVSLIIITPDLDAGDLIAQSKFRLPADIDAPQLTTELIEINNELLNSSLEPYAQGKVKPQPQRGKPSYAPRITKDLGAIDWTKTAQSLEREIRALIGWPGSFATVGGHKVIVLKAAVTKARKVLIPGDIVPNKGQLLIQTGQDWLEITSVKPSGKKAMSGADFVRGYLK